MSVYIGHEGVLELRRNGGDGGVFVTTINPGDVNANARRFSFDDSNTRLITGDRVMISTTGVSAGTNLDFIAATAWLNQGGVQQSWSGWANVDDLGGIRLYQSFQQALENDPINAIQLVAINRDITISIDPTSNTWRALAQVLEYELNTNVETADTSSLGDEFRTQIDTIKTGSGRVSCVWDYTEVDDEIPYYLQQLAVRTEIGQEFQARFYIKGPTSRNAVATYDDLLWYEFTAVITNSGIQFTTTDIVRMTADFVTTGPIRLFARTIPRGVVSLTGGTGAIQLSSNAGGGPLFLSSPTAGTGTPLPPAPTPFLVTLTSSLVPSGNNGTIGDAYKVANQPGSPASATNTSPDLSWSISGNPASPIASWRLRCYDRAGGGSETVTGWAGSWIHWKVDNIPANTLSIAQNGSWPVGATVINNDWVISAGGSPNDTNIQRGNGWGGPLPNGNTYEFFIEAFDAGGNLLGVSNTLSLTSVTP